MRLNTNQTENFVKSNITPDSSHSFGIGDVSVVIDILRNRLYSNKIQTMVQEYICNARDAHREIKQTEKIIVTAPTMTNPTFTVRDFGPGVSPERIANVFVLYGASTKRDSNTQTGGFGIGAKSAWAYTDSFMITTYIDGVKRVYMAHTGQDKIGKLDLLEESETNEVNGTAIQIAVNKNDINAFNEAIRRCTFFWKAEEFPIIKNMPSENFFIDKQFKAKISDTLYFGSNSFGKNSLIVDGIPYYANLNEISAVSEYSCFIFVDTGKVSISANREQLDDSDKTKAALHIILSKAKKEFQEFVKNVQTQVTSIESLVESVNKYNKVFYFVNDLKYKDLSIKYGKFNDPLINNIERLQTTCFYRKKQISLYVNDIHIESWKNGLVYLCDEKDFMTVSKIKAETVARQLSTDIIYIPTKGISKEAKELMVKLGAKSLSSVPYEKPKIVRKTIDMQSNIMFFELTLQGKRQQFKNVKSILTDSDLVYISISEELENKDNVKLAREFSQLGIVGVKVFSKSDIKDVLSQNKDAVHFNDWLNKFKPNKTQMSVFKRFYTSNKNEVTYKLSKLKSYIENKKVLSLLEVVGEDTIKVHLDVYPHTAKFISTYPELNTFKQSTNELYDIIKTNLPLISDTDLHEAPKNLLQEVALYVNLKLKGIK